MVDNNNEIIDYMQETLAQRNHRITLETKKFVKDCAESDVPVFVAYYLPGKGLKYRAILPDELQMAGLEDKFNEFLKVAITFDKNEYFPTIENKVENRKDN